MPRVYFDFGVDASQVDEFNRLSQELNDSLDDYEQRFEKTNRERQRSERRTTDKLIGEQKRLAREAQRNARVQAAAYREAGFALLGISGIIRQVEGNLGLFTTGILRQAAGLETYRATVQAVTRDTEKTNTVLSRLLDLTVDLVGIDTQNLIGYSARLQAAGLSADEAAKAIEGVTKRVAEQGKTSDVTVRALEQFAQAINTDIISYRDFIPILRQVPTLYRDFSDALGVTITSLDDLRAASDAVGGPRAAIVQTLQHMSRAARGADLDTLNAQLDIFYDSSRVLAAELGSHLIPAAVYLFKEINAGIQWFRSLSDEAQSLIAWSAAAATGLTAVGGAATGLAAGFAFLNSSLIATTGTGGLAGLATLLAPAGPIAAGLGLGTALLTPFVALLVKSRLESQNARRASADFARQVSATIQAVGNTAGIERQISALEAYIEKQRDVIRQNEITADAFRTAPSRARATFVSRSGSTAETARERVALAERQIELLGRLDDLSNASAEDLREIDMLLARLLREARESGDRVATRELQASVSAVTQAFDKLQTVTIHTFENTAPIRNFAKEIVSLRNAANEAQDFGNLQENIRAVRELGRVRLEQVDAEIRVAAQPFTLRQQLTDEERQRVIETLQQLGAERLRIENETNQRVRSAYEVDYQNWRETQDRRIAVLREIRELEVQGFRDAATAGEQLASQLSQIASPRFRQEFYDYVQTFQDLGLSFDDAAAKAHEAIGFNRALLFSYRETTTQAERLAEAHAETFESVTSHIRSASDAMSEYQAQLQRVIPTLEQITSRERIDPAGRLSPFSVSRGVVPRIRRGSRGTPLDPVDEFAERLEQMKREEREAQKSLRRQEQQYRQFANQVGSIFSQIATGRIDSFEDVVKAFIASSIRMVTRAFIEYQIQKSLDDRLTASRIANIQKVAAAQSTLGAGGLGNLAGLGRLGSSLSGGGLALGVSALLFPEEVRNLGGGITDTIGGLLSNVASIPDKAFGARQALFLKIGDNEAREITDLQETLKEESRV